MSDSEDFSEISSTSEEGDRLRSLLSLCPRYVVVPPNPPDGIAFALTGNAQIWDHLTDLHSGISNCKPGIWKAEVKLVEGAEFGNCDTEACLRWVADLDEETELDFSISLDEWQGWDQMLKDRFDDSVVEWDEGIAWKHAGTYYDDGGLFNVISMAYLTREAAHMVIEGRDHEELEMDDDEYSGYLEHVTLNDSPIDEEDSLRNAGFTFGGLHFGQDSIGGPPGLAVAEKDGQVVAIKLFMDHDELDEGTPFDSQPGKVVF
ncbi:hypothetical protein M441DRAFT_86126 [Trichoderma asperellum CBS 433.97]|uniref:Uncharacterized protein n=1 Tax=Trichoderma asperellum (strain ATCC 204424 / CBS 433.97 / NBRC 101777) TaxID=1042311 RepID=A0A2T3ZJ34_TRIA4|nr:hypothetical protein M441DRAFT_86126 [Trichoderma asperellum CBS 433.97]PTB44806.1 hypothetical protein M441DRAFT_86126 [Trichoderma asperellum CBS 433.97]